MAPDNDMRGLLPEPPQPSDTMRDKALARALRQAVAIDERQESRVPSTKGQL